MNNENNVNLQGVVENINLRTNIYTPIVEAIVNSVDAIEESKRTDGEIIVSLKRDTQGQIQFDDDSLPDVTSVAIIDNGIGFNDENTNSFNMLYSPQKKKAGGKGFGRFMFLKYFDEVKVDSVFETADGYARRMFDFAVGNQMVANQTIERARDSVDTKTTVYLQGIKSSKFEKKVDTIARKLLERLLIYFINENYSCPKITIKDEGNKDIILNDLLKGDYAEIQNVGDETFNLVKDDNTRTFKIKVFKIFFPENQKSKISLVAHHREVTETPIYTYIPEFEENFYEQFENDSKKDYMVKAYVLGDYLDENVTLERVSFNFPRKGTDSLFPFTQEEIERKASSVTRNLKVFQEELKSREEKKRQKVVDYVEKEAPWHKSYLQDIDMTSVPYHLNDEIIEVELYKARLQQEVHARTKIKEILDNPNASIDKQVEQLVDSISKANTSELVHYVALRKTILRVFKKSLEIKEDGKYSKEEAVHNIIFPTKRDSDSVSYDEHNLWMIDERLNFTEYISSDKPLNGGNSERTDILIFNRKMAFRGGENQASNPITIFEFKKPQRDDFVNKSSEEDPVEQVIRYVNDIRAGKYKTPKGRDIVVEENTPFYGFVICDLTQKVKDWLWKVKDFSPLPDGEGWFTWHKGANLYIEVISWDKVLRDANMRNKIFFRKLGIDQGQ